MISKIKNQKRNIEKKNYLPSLMNKYNKFKNLVTILTYRLDKVANFPSSMNSWSSGITNYYTDSYNYDLNDYDINIIDIWK